MILTPEQAQSLGQFLIPQIEQEATITRKILVAIPAETCGYKPSERCMTALTLAKHIVGAEMMFLNTAATGSFVPPDDAALEPLKTPADVVAYWDAHVPPAIEKLKSLSPEHLAKPVEMFGFTMSNVTYLNFDIKHGVHHRGQLSAYLRPMGAKVPSIYGGSADEEFQAAAH